jgi:hypothetical protein
MSARNWRGASPRTQAEAIKLCVDYAFEKHRRNVERIAELMGTSQYTVYGWIRDESVPGRKMQAFQHACGCDFITRWLAHSSGMLLIPIPKGRKVEVDDVHRVQGTVNTAVGALIRYASGDIDAAQLGTELTAAMETLAFHRENAIRNRQPELELDNHD